MDRSGLTVPKCPVSVCLPVFVPECVVTPKCIKLVHCCWLWLSVYPNHILQGLPADTGHETAQNVTSSSQGADIQYHVSYRCLYSTDVGVISVCGWSGCAVLYDYVVQVFDFIVRVCKVNILQCFRHKDRNKVEMKGFCTLPPSVGWFYKKLKTAADEKHQAA